ncbi:NDP-sugar synthase [Tepidiforma sp.]|uniref:NDP-sugar synthase n=1 Tax=Tepidiforma sp. TaxID=2682230 RepID=UPI002ADD40CC|nr:NDP-sugar synthase [Tepidiforma sp.]
MDAILLVGGQGTRLRPLTAHRHKSLVPVCNTPAIEFLFAWLAKGGISRAILALGLANEDLAARYPPGRHRSLEILPVIETSRLESGGAIRNAVAQAGIEGRFVVLNGDVYLDFPLQRAIEAHVAASAELTLALYPVDDPSPFGVAVCDDRSRVTGFVEKPPPGKAPSNLVNAGAWIFEPHLVEEIPPGPVRVEETLFPSLVARGRTVLGYRFEGHWADLGTPARYLALHRELLGEGNAVHPGATIQPGASVTGSAIGEGCFLRAGASVSGSVLWERVHVGERARITASIIANDATIGPGAVVEGAVIGAGAAIEQGAVLPPGASVQPGARYHASHA